VAYKLKADLTSSLSGIYAAERTRSLVHEISTAHEIASMRRSAMKQANLRGALTSSRSESPNTMGQAAFGLRASGSREDGSGGTSKSAIVMRISKLDKRDCASYHLIEQHLIPQIRARSKNKLYAEGHKACLGDDPMSEESNTRASCAQPGQSMGRRGAS